MKKPLLLLLLVGCGPSQFEKEKALREKEFLQIAKDCLFTIELAVDEQQKTKHATELSMKLAKKSADKIRKEIGSAPSIRYSDKLNIIRGNIVTIADVLEMVSTSPTISNHSDNIDSLPRYLETLKNSMDLLK